MSDFWFARRFPLDSPRSAVAPVHWKGWALFGAFIVLDLIGGAAFAVLAMNGKFVAGLALFLGLTLIGAGALMFFVLTKTDYHRTVEEHRALRAARGENLVQ
jgi:hypothetical protein